MAPEGSRKKDYFYKRILTTGCSLEALQWISFMQSTCDDLIDSNGEHVRIQHKYYRGETNFKGYDVDGFAIVNGICTFFEYLGCYWHPNCPHPECKDGNNRVNGPDERWEEKREFLHKHGKLISIRGCQWKEQKKSMGLKHFSTHDLPLIMNNYGTEEIILNGIQNDNLFGFIVADVSTPDHVMKEILPINFPPIIIRGDITEDHLSDYMKRRVEDRGYKLPQTTLMQVYNAKQVLLYSPMVKFYMSLGLVISNVTNFIQYQPALALDEFAQKVTKGRIAAKKAGNSGLDSANKIIGNM